jgi:phosphatidylglycerophosphate synthase
MLGVVLCADFGERVVLGVPVALRAALSLQAAGVERVLVIGAESPSWLGDDRLKVPCEIASEWPDGSSLVVADGAVVDPKSMRALAAADGEARLHEGLEVVCARTSRGGKSLDEIGRGAETALGGVALFGRTHDELRRSENALMLSLRKPQDGWVSRSINRHLSLAVTRRLVKTGLRPNQVSAAILVIGVASGACAALFGPAGLAVGAVLFQAQSVLDGCDGELSRLTFRGSRTGEWLDTVGDDLTNYSFFTGAALGLRAMGVPAIVWAMGLIGVAIGVIASAIEYRYLVSIGSGNLLEYPLGFGEDPEKPTSPTLSQRVLGAVRPMFKRDFFAFATMIAALAGPATLSAAIVAFSIGAAATLSAVIASEVRRARA